MKKILCFILVFFLVGCSNNKRQFPAQPPKAMSLEELNRELDSLTAKGEYCLVRGSDREYDTIIDHVRYKYVKEEGYDTPIND